MEYIYRILFRLEKSELSLLNVRSLDALRQDWELKLILIRWQLEQIPWNTTTLGGVITLRSDQFSSYIRRRPSCNCQLQIAIVAVTACFCICYYCCLFLVCADKQAQRKHISFLYLLHAKLLLIKLYV